MLDLNAMQQEAAHPLAAGNVLAPLVAYVAELKTASHLEKRSIYAELRFIIERHGADLWPTERIRAREVLESYAEQGAFKEERSDLLSHLQDIPTPPAGGGVGRANVLLVGTKTFSGRSFGTVQPLDVDASAWGGEIVLLPKASDDALYSGFHQGVRAAQEYLLRGGLGTLDGTILLQSYTIEGRFSRLRCPVKGASLGLGAAVAVLSRLWEWRILSDVALTGRIDTAGRVERVEDIPVKLAAAVEKGITQVFLPAANRSDIPTDLPSGLTIVPVTNLIEVVARLFEASAVQKGFARLRAFPLPPELRKRHWLVEETIPEGAARILLICVGRADPVGQHLDRNRSPIGREEGPILTLCRDLHPATVYLLHTCQPGDNDYTEKTMQIKAFLEEEDPACRVIPVPLPTLVDPSDYAQLFPAFKEAVLDILGKEDRAQSTFFVNLSSGSPQMETTWHLLSERKYLRAILLQVREGRYVRDGGSRVRRVVLPAL